jgi:hypothetical protein
MSELVQRQLPRHRYGDPSVFFGCKSYSLKRHTSGGGGDTHRKTSMFGHNAYCTHYRADPPDIPPRQAFY